MMQENLHNAGPCRAKCRISCRTGAGARVSPVDTVDNSPTYPHSAVDNSAQTV